MRPIAAASVLLLALALLAAPAALATGEAHAEKGRARAAEAKALHHDAHGTDEAPRPHEAKADKPVHKRVADGLLAGLAALRESWKADAAALREGCHAGEPDRPNATKEARLGWAHCIRDGYHQLFKALRAERAALRDARHA